MNRNALLSIIGAAFALTVSHDGAAQDGETSFDTFCAVCHVNPTDENVPPLAAVRDWR
jgi:cytochrome c5